MLFLRHYPTNPKSNIELWMVNFSDQDMKTGPERFGRILIGNDGIFTINIKLVNITIRRQLLQR